MTAGSPAPRTPGSRTPPGSSADCSNIAPIPGTATGIVAYWTDLRLENCFALPSGCGRHGSDAFFASVG
jgi:hypothetical protein